MYIFFSFYLHEGQERKEERVRRGRKKKQVVEGSERETGQLGTIALRVQSSSPARRVRPSPTEARAASARWEHIDIDTL